MSAAVAERLGMVRRADIVYPGPAWAETPVIVYEMEKAAWTARHS